MERYIEFFNGYRNAYGVADFNHQDSKVDYIFRSQKPRHPLEMVEIDLRLLASDQRLRLRDFANYTFEKSWS